MSGEFKLRLMVSGEKDGILERTKDPLSIAMTGAKENLMFIQALLGAEDPFAKAVERGYVGKIPEYLTGAKILAEEIVGNGRLGQSVSVQDVLKNAAYFDNYAIGRAYYIYAAIERMRGIETTENRIYVPVCVGPVNIKVGMNSFFARSYLGYCGQDVVFETCRRNEPFTYVFGTNARGGLDSSGVDLESTFDIMSGFFYGAILSAEGGPNVRLPERTRRALSGLNFMVLYEDRKISMMVPNIQSKEQERLMSLNIVNQPWRRDGLLSSKFIGQNLLWLVHEGVHLEDIGVFAGVPASGVLLEQKAMDFEAVYADEVGVKSDEEWYAKYELATYNAMLLGVDVGRKPHIQSLYENLLFDSYSLLSEEQQGLVDGHMST